jgi:hypothetical protein
VSRRTRRRMKSSLFNNNNISDKELCRCLTEEHIKKESSQPKMEKIDRHKLMFCSTFFDVV